MGDDPPNGQGPGGFPTQGDPSDHGKIATAASVQKLGIYPLEEAMREAGLEDVEAYVLMRQNTVAQYIAMRTILDLCKEVVQRQGCGFLNGGGNKRGSTWEGHIQRQRRRLRGNCRRRGIQRELTQDT